MSNRQERKQQLVQEANEAGATGLNCKHQDPKPVAIISTPTATYAVRQKYTSGWDFTLKGATLAKHYRFCAGTELTPAIAFKFDTEDWRVATITDDTPAVAAGQLKLTHRQVRGIGESLDRLAGGHSPKPVESASYLDRFHQSRIPLNDQNKPKPEWSDVYMTQNDTVYYEVPVDQDHYMVVADDPDNIPRSVEETWTSESDDGTRYYAVGPREAVTKYLRATDLLEADEDDVTLREASARANA